MRGRDCTFAAHGDGVGYTDGIELPGEQTFLLKTSLDDVAEIEDFPM